MFGIALEIPKSAFNTQKVRLKKKYSFDKKIKSTFNGPKSLKIAKKYFWQKFKNEAFAQKLILI
jgi:hypothetical protein